jgi:hypothetical protein
MKLFSGDAPTPALACAAALLGAACMPTDGAVATYLLVAQAARQPGSSTPETIVVLQQRGGKFLRLKTQGGTFQLPGDASNASSRTSACVAALPDDDLGFYTITPANGECSLSVALLGAGAECSGPLLQDKIIPVSSKRTVVDTTSGAGGSGGSGGSGGADSGTTSTSSAGGK